MSARMVKCIKLGQELPGIDENTPDGRKALKLALVLGGPETRQRVHDEISAQAWQMWKDHMLMVVNEYRLDASTDQANAILNKHMQAFLFGTGSHVPGYVAPDK